MPVTFGSSINKIPSEIFIAIHMSNVKHVLNIISVNISATGKYGAIMMENNVAVIR